MAYISSAHQSSSLPSSIPAQTADKAFASLSSYPTIPIRTSSLNFSTARTHQPFTRSRSFGRLDDQLWDEIAQEDTKPQDLSPAKPTVDLDGTNEPCFSCEDQSILCKLHRPHGLPLHTILERQSQSTLYTTISTRHSSAILYRDIHLRHSHSAPEALVSHSEAQGDARQIYTVFKPQDEDYRICSDVSLNHKIESEKQNTSNVRPLSPDSMEVKTRSWTPERLLRFRSPRSAVDLSPRKNMSEALREVARLLRGQSPVKRRYSPVTSSKRSSVSSLDNSQPGSVDEIRQETPAIEHAANFKSMSPIDWQSLSRGATPTARPPSSPSKDSLLDDWPVLPRRLTVRNRSSFDTALSNLSSTSDLGLARPDRSHLYDAPRPLFSINTPGRSQDAIAMCHYNADAVPSYRGPWLTSRVVTRNASLTVDRELHTIATDCSAYGQGLVGDRSEYESTLDNFDRLRLFASNVNDDPFLDRSSQPQFASPAQPSPTLAHESRSTIHMPSPLRIRTDKSQKLSLWPSPEAVPPAVRPLPNEPCQLRSISSMLRIHTTSTGFDGNTNSTGAPSDKICPHGKPIVRPHLFTGAKLKRAKPPSWFSSKRAQGCWRCEMQDFKDGARMKARSEGYLTIGRTSFRKKAGLKRSRSTVSQRAKEWIAVRCDPGSLEGRQGHYDGAAGLVYLPVEDRTSALCAHGRSRKCWRCRSRFVGRSCMAWMAKKCFCADYGQGRKKGARRKFSTESERPIMTQSVSPDHSQAPGLRRVDTRSSIE